MKRSRIAVGGLILAAGLGMASGTPHPDSKFPSTPHDPVVKCRGSCLNGAAARAADTRLRVLAGHYAAQQTLVPARCIFVSAVTDTWDAAPVLEPPLPLPDR